MFPIINCFNTSHHNVTNHLKSNNFESDQNFVNSSDFNINFDQEILRSIGMFASDNNTLCMTIEDFNVKIIKDIK